MNLQNVTDLIIESKAEEIAKLIKFEGMTREAAIAKLKSESTLGAGSWATVETLIDAAMAKPMRVKRTALDVVDGDIIYNCGYRCRVTNVEHYPDNPHLTGRGPTARYTLTSEPTEYSPRTLPQTYEGMTSGGNSLADVTIER